METYLVVNPGSTSKKFAFFQADRLVLSLHYEHTKDGFGVCRSISGESQKCEGANEESYRTALQSALRLAAEQKIVTDESPLRAVGVRVVAPGEYFQRHRLVDDQFRERLSKQALVAPLHVPPILEELAVIKGSLPAVPVYALSDSAFHTTIPEARRQLSFPTGLANEHGLKRYGYHGLSMASVTRRLESFFGFMPERVVVAHVGGGVSLTALWQGKSVDTTMGFSPASGLAMSSRGGDISADALLALMSHDDRPVGEWHKFLNTDCGFMGWLGVSDFRLVLDRVARADETAKLALEAHRYQFQRQLGSMFATLGGLDAFVFTATAAERNPSVRELFLGGLPVLGITLDKERNESLLNTEGMIHSDFSQVSVGVMKTEEMREMVTLLRELDSVT